MEIQKRKDQKQGGTLAGADLSGAINSQKEISGYYDQMATDMMRVADAGVTHFTNSMIEDAKVEGEVAGKEGSKKGSRTATKEDAGDGTKVDANGQPIKEGKAMATAPGGYERQNQIFKWNRTFNNSAQKTFQTNTTAQASGYAKQVAKQVNGNMGAYKTVMNETKSQAMAGTTDPRQRAHIESAYDSAFAKNMGTVTTTGIKIQTKLAEQTWKFGRQEFQDNLAIKQNIITQASADMYNPDLDEKTQREAGEKLKTAQAEYEKMVVKRLEDSAPGINLGAYTYEQVKFDTREDMRDSHITSEIYTLTQMDKKKEGGLYTYKDNPNLNAHENKEARDAVYEHIASVNSAEIVQESRETRHINQEKRVVKTKIKTAVLNVNDDEFLDSMGITDDQVADGKSQVMTQIQNAYKSNLINKAERDTYIDELLNGTEVTKDNMQTYSSINSNIEDFTAEMIVGRTDLTDATLKELLKKREKWETEGEEWMKLPDYSEGKSIIRGAYGFNEAGMLPEFLTGDKLNKYLEMQATVEEYRSQVRGGSAKGERNIAVGIARGILGDKNKDARSSIYKNREEVRVLSKDKVEKALQDREKTTTNVKKILDEQLKNFPKTEMDPTIEDIVPKKVKEEKSTSFFDFIFGEDEPDAEAKAKAKAEKLSDAERAKLRQLLEATSQGD